jgi:hypothetical protein
MPLSATNKVAKSPADLCRTYVPVSVAWDVRHPIPSTKRADKSHTAPVPPKAGSNRRGGVSCAINVQRLRCYPVAKLGLREARVSRIAQSDLATTGPDEEIGAHGVRSCRAVRRRSPTHPDACCRTSHSRQAAMAIAEVL